MCHTRKNTTHLQVKIVRNISLWKVNFKMEYTNFPHVACMGEGKGVYRVLVGRPKGKKLLGRPRHRWEDNIKLDHREIGINGVDWIQLAQNRVQWQGL
jgi:hypothetical protein